MKLNEMINAIQTIKKGRMVKVHYITIKGDYSKETKTTIRFCNYGKISGVQVKGKPNPNEQTIIKDILVYNTNTKNYYLIMKTINTNHKAKVKYFYKGQEIDKATFDSANPSKPNQQPLITFKKNINDIISLG